MPSFFSSDWFFIIILCLVWFIAGIFIYGFAGPKKWRKEGNEYADKVLIGNEIEKPLTSFQIFAVIVEILIPIAVLAFWILFHHKT